MRFASLLVLSIFLAAAASAQTSFEPPPWRIGVGGGLADGAQAVSASAAVERLVSGPVALGFKASAYGDSGFVDDVAPPVGVALDAFGVAASRGRVLDLRAGAGVGISLIGFSGGFADGDSGCFEEDDGTLTCFKTTSNLGPRPYAAGFAGLDVYPTPSLGLGLEVRGVLMNAYELSSVELGVRLRL